MDGALYESLEFTGEGVDALSMDDRLVRVQHGDRGGRKERHFPGGRQDARQFLADAGAKPPKVYAADADAVYSRVVEIDLDRLTSVVAFPHLPENGKTFDEIGEVKIDSGGGGLVHQRQAISDLREAAAILKGRKVAKGVRALIIPATQKIWNAGGQGKG